MATDSGVRRGGFEDLPSRPVAWTRSSWAPQLGAPEAACRILTESGPAGQRFPSGFGARNRAARRAPLAYRTLMAAASGPAWRTRDMRQRSGSCVQALARRACRRGGLSAWPCSPASRCTRGFQARSACRASTPVVGQSGCEPVAFVTSVRTGAAAAREQSAVDQCSDHGSAWRAGEESAGREHLI